MNLPCADFEITWPVAFGLEVSCGVLVAWSAPRGRSGATAAAILSVAAFLLPIFVVAEPRIARAMVAFWGVLCLFRLVDFLRGARLGSLVRRVWFVFSPFDIRQIFHSSPALDIGQAMAMVGYAFLTTLSIFALLRLPATPSFPLILARWLVGTMLCYTTADTLVAAIHVSYRLAGFVTPEIHRIPILSRSIREFWSERWNRPVHEWLSRHCFRPLARRRLPMIGVSAAFMASAAIHVWITIFGAGIKMAAMMGVFFLLQAVFIVVERILQVDRWPTLAARSWTITCLVASSPLFVEPMLRILGL